MAESNQRKIADQIDIDDDDPFAELTRIMGFDPRKSSFQSKELPGSGGAVPPPVNQTASGAAPAAQPATTAPHTGDDDDFGIDLEKELLGGFDDFEPPVEPAAALLRTVAPAETPVGAASYRPAEVAAPAEPIAIANEEEFEDALTEAIDWEPMEAELASAQSAVAGHPLEQEDELFDAAPAATAAAPAVDDDLDVDLAAELDRDLSGLETEDPAPVAEVAASGVSAWSAPQQPIAADAWSGQHHDADRQDGYDVPAEDEALPEFDLADLDLHDDEADEVAAGETESEPVAELAAEVEERLPPPQPAKEAPAVEVFADVDMDFSAAFEEEFDDTEREAPAEAAAPAGPAAPEEAPKEASVAPVAEARPGEPARAVSDDIDVALEDELSALLDEEQARPPVRQSTAGSPVAVPSAPAVVDRPRGNFLSDPRWAALEAVEEDESVSSSSRVLRPAASTGRFDQAAAADRRSPADGSLTGRHANFQVPARSAPQPADDLDDLLDAMEHETHEPQPAPKAVAAAVPSRQPQAGAAPMAAVAAVAVVEERQDFADNTNAAQEARYDDGVPDIDTVDVPEPAVAMADDLDLPSLAYEEDEPRRAAAYDDIEADFAASFQRTLASEEPVNRAASAQAGERTRPEVDFAPLYRPVQPQAEASATADEIEFESLAGEDDGRSYDDFEQAPAAARQQERYVDLDFADDFQGEALPALAAAAAYQEIERPRRIRGPLIAALVGSVALLGGAGALAFSYYGGGQADAPVLVKADEGPVKIKPENPGGAAVPNQDNKVYDAVKGAAAAEPAAPAQPKLVTTQEEPIDVAAVDKAEAAPDPVTPPMDEVEAPDAQAHVGSVAALPGVDTVAALPGVNDSDKVVPKGEDRVDPVADADQEVPADDGIAIAPRKVRTMVVRADGTLVPRDELAAAAETDTATVAAASEPALPPANDETGAVEASGDQPAYQAPGGPAVPVKTVKSTKVNGEGKAATETVPPKPVRSTKVDPDGKPQTVASTDAAAPAPKPAAKPSALPPAATEAAAAKPAADPAPQPTQAKAAAPAQPKPKSKPVEVASANVEPTAAPSGSWSVQIASQPSADAAKSTYKDLSQRYASVLGGRGVNIVKADIEGKGTYWRVRVPAKSRDDAIDLCTSYKSAGGTCFVSK